MAAFSLVLLAGGVGGALGHLRRPLLVLVPLALALAAVAASVVSVDAAGAVLADLVEPLAFLLTAVPLAVLLDEAGAFEAVARRLPARWVAPGLWAVGAVTVALVNLDAAVVLLTPVAVRAARRSGEDPVGLALQPALLACLASSFLPVSNLTNLIAEQDDPQGPVTFLRHLGPPSVVAVAVGYLLWRLWFRRPATAGAPTAGAEGVTRAVAGRPDGESVDGSTLPAAGPETAGGRVVASGVVDRQGPADDRAALVTAAVVGAALLAGFTVGGVVGVPPWVVSTAVLVGLAVRARRVPVDAVPWASAATVAALAVLAVGAAARVDLAGLLGSGEGAGGTARVVGVGALGANLVNNLPAFLAGRPHLPPGEGARWAWLLGVNAGPSLLVTGSLAGLLWLDVARRSGLDVGPRDYLRAGLRVGLPALAAATAVLVLLAP